LPGGENVAHGGQYLAGDGGSGGGGGHDRRGGAQAAGCAVIREPGVVSLAEGAGGDAEGGEGVLVVGASEACGEALGGGVAGGR